MQTFADEQLAPITEIDAKNEMSQVLSAGPVGLMHAASDVAFPCQTGHGDFPGEVDCVHTYTDVCSLA